MLLDEGHRVVCLDRCFFGTGTVAHLTGREGFTLVRDDTRSCAESVFEGIDVVMDLSGFSNDPACDLDEALTESINYTGTMRMGRLAREYGVRQYLFSSSCSVYGSASGTGLTETSAVSPVSLYAECKCRAETGLLDMCDRERFRVAILRNATVFGLSPRMRFDLMINLMTGFAVTQKRIYVLGGGRQWRPNVHVRDVARAFSAIMGADAALTCGEVFNVGSTDQNLRVIQAAHIVQAEIPGTDVVVAPDDVDKRDYHVNCDKIGERIGFGTEYDVLYGIREVRDALVSDACEFRASRTVTVEYYKYLRDAEITLNDVKLNGHLF